MVRRDLNRALYFARSVHVLTMVCPSGFLWAGYGRARLEPGVPRGGGGAIFRFGWGQSLTLFARFLAECAGDKSVLEWLSGVW